MSCPVMLHLVMQIWFLLYHIRSVLQYVLSCYVAPCHVSMFFAVIILLDLCYSMYCPVMLHLVLQVWFLLS